MYPVEALSTLWLLATVTTNDTCSGLLSEGFGIKDALSWLGTWIMEDIEEELPNGVTNEADEGLVGTGPISGPW